MSVHLWGGAGARGPEGIAAVERALEGLREVAVDRNVQRAALAAMRELAATGSHGAHGSEPS